MPAFNGAAGAVDENEGWLARAHSHVLEGVVADFEELGRGKREHDGCSDA